MPTTRRAWHPARPTNKHGSRHGIAVVEQGKARVVIQKGKK